ncbi:hypothetical protein XA3_17170 [Xylocopilactobacillus apicola]|uniref:ABC transporter permease n=2 Tax=Xylocopilactobacillus apicola TaxID=2932184 RepID=A0AAU9DA17_9LACO|nr:hypothetical protein XA3_17170 [Xylocopilactobacillus apicola]
MAITVGIVGEFALSIIGVLMFNLIKKWEFLKWNPLNFLNLPAQLSQPAFYHPLTRLTDLQLIGGNICYIALFLALGLVLFAQKEV